MECYLGDGDAEPGYADFWRASKKGQAFLLRGYKEDGLTDEVKPGAILDLAFPIWRVGECLLHAERLAKNMDHSSDTQIAFRTTWTGLEGRRLASVTGRRHIRSDYICRANQMTNHITVPGEHISEGLDKYVAGLLHPLYELFDFFELQQGMVREELNRMLKH